MTNQQNQRDMKKYLIASVTLAILLGCGGGDSNKGNEEKKSDATDITKNPDYQKGLELIGSTDCLTCHRVDETLQGPSYRDVANKYASYPDTIIGHLAKKIIKGGNDGIWNMPGQMTPHPSLQPEDAETIVRYILLLKK